MIFWLVLVICIFIIIFGLVVAFGAPYLPTLKPQYMQALDMINLKPGQKIIDLGSGDGRVLKEAARRGILGIGIELNPILVLISKINTWHYRKSVKIIWGNYWKANLPKTDGIFVFLIDKYMVKLDEKISHNQPKPVQIVSFAFKIPDKKTSKKSNGLYLYKYN